MTNTLHTAMVAALDTLAEDGTFLTEEVEAETRAALADSKGKAGKNDVGEASALFGPTYGTQPHKAATIMSLIAMAPADIRGRAVSTAMSEDDRSAVAQAILSLALADLVGAGATKAEIKVREGIVAVALAVDGVDLATMEGKASKLAEKALATAGRKVSAPKTDVAGNLAAAVESLGEGAHKLSAVADALATILGVEKVSTGNLTKYANGRQEVAGVIAAEVNGVAALAIG